MKISSSSMSILSPDRPRDPPQISLSSSLSKSLRTNPSFKGGLSAPMFPTGGKKRGCSFENLDPSSPKVTCIGQVRVKTNPAVIHTEDESSSTPRNLPLPLFTPPGAESTSLFSASATLFYGRPLFPDPEAANFPTPTPFAGPFFFGRPLPLFPDTGRGSSTNPTVMSAVAIRVGSAVPTAWPSSTFGRRCLLGRPRPRFPGVPTAGTGSSSGAGWELDAEDRSWLGEHGRAWGEG